MISAHVVYRFLIGLYALTAIIQPCLCGTSPGSIVMIVPDGNTSSINQSNPSLNITYWVDDTNLPSEKGYSWNITYVFQDANQTLFPGGSVANNCSASASSNASFTRHLDSSGGYIIYAYVTYFFPKEGANCTSGPWNVESQVVNGSFFIQNTPAQGGVGSYVTTTLTLPAAPTGAAKNGAKSNLSLWFGLSWAGLVLSVTSILSQAWSI